MTAAQQQTYPAPFDAVAARYDQDFTHSVIGRAQRAPVWNELAKAFHPGNRILEIGCGTGVDACFLAERGIYVLACDSSSRMIEETTRRVLKNRLDLLVQPLLMPAEKIGILSADAPFDGAYSNFGALNCVQDLRQLAVHLGRLVKPGGTILLCWMGPYCLWEMIWYLAQGNSNKAFRRLREGVNARLADEAFVHVHYPSVRQLARPFAPEFRLQSIRGIGITVPPSYLEIWAAGHPRLLQRCEKADSWMGTWPGVRLLGDHVLVRLQRDAKATES